MKNRYISQGKKTLTIEAEKGKRKKKNNYVYGMGELAAVYNKAGYAVQKAEQVSGVVISSEQKYVWEKGNRDLVYSTEAGKFQCEEGESSLDACERYMEQYHAQRLDLTGCSLDQMLYVINRGCPMIAILESAHAVLLTGYTMTDITYVDPSTGESYTVGNERNGKYDRSRRKHIYRIHQMNKRRTFLRKLDWRGT